MVACLRQWVLRMVVCLPLWVLQMVVCLPLWVLQMVECLQLWVVQGHLRLSQCLLADLHAWHLSIKQTTRAPPLTNSTRDQDLSRQVQDLVAQLLGVNDRNLQVRMELAKAHEQWRHPPSDDAAILLVVS